MEPGAISCWWRVESKGLFSQSSLTLPLNFYQSSSQWHMYNIISLLFTRSSLAKTSLNIILTEIMDEWANENFSQSALTFDIEVWPFYALSRGNITSWKVHSPDKLTLSMEIPGWRYGYRKSILCQSSLTFDLCIWPSILSFTANMCCFWISIFPVKFQHYTTFVAQ